MLNLLYKIEPNTLKEEDVNKVKGGFIVGFNKAIELNKDKLFTIQDVQGLLQDIKSRRSLHNVAWNDAWENFINSKQISEIDVSIDMCYDGECDGNNNNGCFQDSPGHDCGCFKRIEKKDNNNCIILVKL